MKKTVTLLLTSLFVLGKVSAQNYVPVASSGYTVDAVAENTTSLVHTSSAIDASDWVMYTAGYGVIGGGLAGLPNNGVISAGTRTYQLQNYAASNLLYITANLQDSLTITNPAPYLGLSLLGFATEGAGTASVTVRFTDNSTEVFSSLSFPDWFNVVPVPFYNGFDRVSRTLGTIANVGGAGNPRMFTSDMPISCGNQSKMVKRIIIKNTSGARLCVMAVSGITSPLTATASPIALCNTGGTVTLTAGGTPTFTWLPAGSFAGSNGTVVSVSPAVTTEYTLRGTTGLNCVLETTISVTVFTAAPTLTITNTAPSGGICPTKTVMLTASGATSYTWAGGVPQVTNGVAFAALTSVDYTVTAGNACGTSTAVSSVSVHPLPIVNASANSPSLCSGSTLTLSGSGNAVGSYTWTGGVTTITNGVGFVPPPGIAAYTVTGTSALSCTASAVITVTVIQTPLLPSVAIPSIVCIGNSATLVAVGASNYTWASASQTVFTPTMTVTPTATGVSTYTITKSNASCSDTKIISITTNSLPTVFALASPAQVCALQPSTISIAGGSSYTWTAPGTPTYNFNGSSVVVYPIASSLYTVAASDGTCITVTTLSLTVDQNPTVSITASTPSVCIGQSVTLNAGGGNSYTWTTPSGTLLGSTIQVSPTAPTDYTLTGDNASGCKATANQIILAFPVPAITVVANQTVVCSGNPSTLTASGASSYTWDANANNILTPGAVVNPTATVTGPFIYTVTGSYTTGCASSKTAAVTVYVPTVSILGNTNTCAGGKISFTVAGNTGTATWTTSAGILTGNPITTTISAPAIFTVGTGGTAFNITCPLTQTIAVGINANPTVIAIPQRTTICKFEHVEIHAGGATSYTWQNPGSGSVNGATLTVSPQNLTNNYTVTGTDANGCVSTGSTQVKVSTCPGFGELSNGSVDMSIFPNPNHGEFTISASEDVSLILINSLGQTVRNVSLQENNSHTISINGLAKGVYFLCGKDGSTRINHKIIVAE